MLVLIFTVAILWCNISVFQCNACTSFWCYYHAFISCISYIFLDSLYIRVMQIRLYFEAMFWPLVMFNTPVISTCIHWIMHLYSVESQYSFPIKCCACLRICITIHTEKRENALRSAPLCHNVCLTLHQLTHAELKGIHEETQMLARNTYADGLLNYIIRVVTRYLVLFCFPIMSWMCSSSNPKIQHKD